MIKLNKKKYILIGIVVIVFCVIAGTYQYWTSNLLSRTGRYTIGTIENVEGARGGVKVYVNFVYKGKIYHINSVDASSNIKKTDIGRRIILKFIPSNPTLYAEYSIGDVVPDSFGMAQDEGWTNKPVLKPN